MPNPKNEGDANRIAARQFNENQKKFAKSGRVAEGAADAKRAVDASEGEKLKQAEEASLVQRRS